VRDNKPLKKGLIQKQSLWRGGLIRGVWRLIKKTCAKRKTTFLVKVFTEGKKKKLLVKLLFPRSLRSIFGQTFPKSLLIKLS